MNALNILSGLSAAPPSSPPQSRSASSTNINAPHLDTVAESEHFELDAEESPNVLEDGEKEAEHAQGAESSPDEETPLLQQTAPGAFGEERSTKSWRLPKRIADAVVMVVQFLLAALFAPARFLVASFYDDQGTLRPLRRLSWVSQRNPKASAYAADPLAAASHSEGYEEMPSLRPTREDGQESFAEEKHASPGDAETESPSSQDSDDSPATRTRSKTTIREDVPPAKKSIRIKLHNEATANKERRHRAQRSVDGTHSGDDRVVAVANSLKSPSSPSVTKLQYPRAPAPPRPLVPRRQPSYTISYSAEAPKKTLIIDLDETLIHSMAKGGRMSTGHMVEVKFQGPIGGGGIVLGPQVPILYYVHERPHCHEFLRKVCKWYNLIVFTASVQEYADPVIDWLERERKYFSGRYYRQHCTFRNGAYIKDLSQVEPDLSKVMILDNSPMSYIFHEDNAIPIEGWISDPTDGDLLHLVPMLEGLQYVTDVRALLALRLGQAERA